MKFLVDEMLGKLAKWLRMLGYDTVYIKDKKDNYIVNQAFKEQRVLLTRDTGMIQRKYIPRYVLIHSDFYLDQVKQVIKECNISTDPEKFFSRCLLCNSKIISVVKNSVKELVPPYVFKEQKDFFVCKNCNKVYWKGTHIENAKRKIESILQCF